MESEADSHYIENRRIKHIRRPLSPSEGEREKPRQPAMYCMLWTLHEARYESTARLFINTLLQRCAKALAAPMKPFSTVSFFLWHPRVYRADQPKRETVGNRFPLDEGRDNTPLKPGVNKNLV